MTKPNSVKKGVRERLYVIDKYDGQIMCLSGDKHFFLIDVTDSYKPIPQTRPKASVVKKIKRCTQ